MGGYRNFADRKPRDFLDCEKGRSHLNIKKVRVNQANCKRPSK